MRERLQAGTTLHADTFNRPISELRSRDREVVCVRPSASVGRAIALMQKEHIGALVVTDERGMLVGIVTERDLLMKVLGRVERYEHLPVSEIMTPRPESLHETDQLAYLINVMHLGGFRHVPVVDEHGAVKQIVSVRDVLAFVLERFTADIQNIPPSLRAARPRAKAPDGLDAASRTLDRCVPREPRRRRLGDPRADRARRGDARRRRARVPVEPAQQSRAGAGVRARTASARASARLAARRADDSRLARADRGRRATRGRARDRLRRPALQPRARQGARASGAQGRLALIDPASRACSPSTGSPRCRSSPAATTSA